MIDSGMIIVIVAIIIRKAGKTSTIAGLYRHYDHQRIFTRIIISSSYQIVVANDCVAWLPSWQASVVRYKKLL